MLTGSHLCFQGVTCVYWELLVLTRSYLYLQGATYVYRELYLQGVDWLIDMFTGS